MVRHGIPLAGVMYALILLAVSFLLCNVYGQSAESRRHVSNARSKGSVSDLAAPDPVPLSPALERRMNNHPYAPSAFNQPIPDFLPFGGIPRPYDQQLTKSLEMNHREGAVRPLSPLFSPSPS